MQFRTFLAETLSLLLLTYVVLGAETSSSSGCTGSQETVVAIVNASANFMLDTTIVNCLSFSDNVSSISLGIVSHASGATLERSTVQCVSGVLAVFESSFPYNDTVNNCYQCMDSNNLATCPNNAECSEGCRSCYGPSQSECLVCAIGRYNGTCVDTCPPGTTPQLEYGNECRCPGNFGGTNCEECLLTHDDCPNAYYLNKTSCTCSTCLTSNGFVLELVDHEARVPESVIGEPLGEECGQHEKRRRRNTKRATTDGHHDDGVSAIDEEELTCERQCELKNWRAREDNDYICYACGVKYCIECDVQGRCEKCREGTLLNEHDHECVGFYEEICTLAEEFEHEVEVEEEALKEYQLHLKIALPIVCVFVLFVFVFFAVFAHFRYPHVGHAKRHRKPNKVTKEKTEFEKVLRPQSTVIFR